MINVPDARFDIDCRARTEVAKSHISRSVCDGHSRRHRSDARIASDRTDKSVLTAIFDRRVNESIPLAQGHEHEQGRAERFAEQTECFRKAIKANPELAACVDPNQLLDGELGSAMEEQIRTELKEIVRTI